VRRSKKLILLNFVKKEKTEKLLNVVLWILLVLMIPLVIMVRVVCSPPYRVVVLMVVEALLHMLLLPLEAPYGPQSQVQFTSFLFLMMTMTCLSSQEVRERTSTCMILDICGSLLVVMYDC
jgi:hypothetical protein